MVGKKGEKEVLTGKVRHDGLEFGITFSILNRHPAILAEKKYKERKSVSNQIKKEKKNKKNHLP